MALFADSAGRSGPWFLGPFFPIRHGTSGLWQNVRGTGRSFAIRPKTHARNRPKCGMTGQERLRSSENGAKVICRDDSGARKAAGCQSLIASTSQDPVDGLGCHYVLSNAAKGLWPPDDLLGVGHDRKRVSSRERPRRLEVSQEGGFVGTYRHGQRGDARMEPGELGYKGLNRSAPLDS